MSPQRIFTLVVLLLAVAVLIVAASRSQKIELPTQRNPLVINSTKNLEVISAVRNGGEVYIALRNNYDKNVTAFAISIGNFRFTEEFVYSEVAEAGILPRTSYERRFPVPTSADSNSSKPINIQAALWDGGAGEGNSAIIQEISDERLGERIQIERTLKLLDSYLSFPDAKFVARVGEMKSQIVSKLDSPEADALAAVKELQPARQSNLLSDEIQSGLSSGKQRVLRKLQDVEAAQNPREDLLKVRGIYEKFLRRL